MKFIVAVILCGLFGTLVFAQTADYKIIPQPKSVQKLSGEFKLSRKTKIVATEQVGRRSAAVLNDLLLKNYGFKLEVTDKAPKTNAIIFMDQGFPVNKVPREAYGVNIIPKGVLIMGSETGQFYGIQTLMQILPVSFKGEATLPAIDISDEPRFAYRGMHLDVTRHFMPVSFVKKYIDLMAQYKFNQFHWHLTDDQGWRIEIKKYPKLTEIASRRPETMLEKNFNPYKGDSIPVSGFYTQGEIKDVVAYAKARKINVIPEIELPGHASAALAAYPEFGCKENFSYKVQTTWGIFKEVFCPTDATFKFLEDVLDETIALFPDSPYIHIGGDEVLKDHWKESAFVQELMKRENLKDEHEVQSYFIRRMEKFINAKGKTIIGWDEILEGGLAPNAVVMSWRGEKGGIEAARSKHNVIMTPSSALYFDYGQGDPAFEPINIGNYLPLETVYNYNPIPKELDAEQAKYILGAQANVWTEYLKTPENVEYMVFPRLLALAEVVWSPQESRNYGDFQNRLAEHFARLDNQKVNYRIPAPEGLRNIVLGADGKALIELKAFPSNAKIYYTLDGSTPDERSKLYEKPLEIELKPLEIAILKTVVVNEKGRKSVPYTATILHREMRESVSPLITDTGVRISFFQGNFGSVKEVDVAEPVEVFDSKSIQLAQFSEKTDKFKTPFGAIFDGYINVPADGIYEFELESDDGAVFLIGEEAVVDLDAARGKQKATGIVPLKKGYHKIRLKYFQNEGDAVLNLRWGIKGTGLRRIYGNELVH